MSIWLRSKDGKPRQVWRSRSLPLTILVSCLASQATAEQIRVDPIRSPKLNADLRLQIVGSRLASANAERCSDPEMLTGMMLHDEAGFDARDRTVMRNLYGFGYGFGVVQVVPGSVADQAGLRRGDAIVTVNEVDLANYGRDLVKARGSYDRTERFVGYLSEALRAGPAHLTIVRGGVRRTVAMPGERGCGGHFVVLPDKSLNAWSDGRYVAVSSRMMQFADDDAELAFVVAHEMAHNILGHNKRFKGATLVLAEFGIGTNKVRKAELEADALAVELMANAGYDLSAPERLLRRSSNAMGINLSISHPGINRRIGLVQGAVVQLGSRDLGRVALASARGFEPPTARLPMQQMPKASDISVSRSQPSAIRASAVSALGPGATMPVGAQAPVSWQLVIRYNHENFGDRQARAKEFARQLARTIAPLTFTQVNIEANYVVNYAVERRPLAGVVSGAGGTPIAVLGGGRGPA